MSASRPIQFWRGFFPSWRFFDKYGQVPRLFYQEASEESSLEQAPWCELLPQGQLSTLSLVYNPEHNLKLFIDTLLRQLLLELQSVETTQVSSITQTTSYQVLRKTVEQKLTESSARQFYRFKVSVGLPGFAEPAGEVLIASTIYQVGAPVA